VTWRCWRNGGEPARNRGPTDPSLWCTFGAARRQHGVAGRAVVGGRLTPAAPGQHVKVWPLPKGGEVVGWLAVDPGYRSSAHHPLAGAGGRGGGVGRSEHGMAESLRRKVARSSTSRRADPTNGKDATNCHRINASGRSPNRGRARPRPGIP
jgi:hypothetical protein